MAGTQKTPGRMLRQDISYSESVNSLSLPAAFLFSWIIPHLSSYGKMKGEPSYIKAKVCPLRDDIPVDRIAGYLFEISRKTNMKWFKAEGKAWIHALEFAEHQDLRKDRMGEDSLPSYHPSFPAPGLPPAVAECGAPAGETPPPVVTPAGVPAKKKTTSVINPDEFKPTAEDVAVGRSNGLDSLEIAYQAERFIIYAKERAAKKPRDAYKDLSKAFCNWLTGPFFKPMPLHVRQARAAAQNKKLDEIEYDIKPMVEVGPPVKVAKLPFEAE